MPDEEFDSPDANYYVLRQELKQRIQDLQLDRESVRDKEVRGIIEKIYTDLKIEYFKLSKDYIALIGMSRELDTQDTRDSYEEELDGIL